MAAGLAPYRRAHLPRACTPIIIKAAAIDVQDMIHIALFMPHLPTSEAKGPAHECCFTIFIRNIVQCDLMPVFGCYRRKFAQQCQFCDFIIVTAKGRARYKAVKIGQCAVSARQFFIYQKEPDMRFAVYGFYIIDLYSTIIQAVTVKAFQPAIPKEQVGLALARQFCTGKLRNRFKIIETFTKNVHINKDQYYA